MDVECLPCAIGCAECYHENRLLIKCSSCNEGYTLPKETIPDHDIYCVKCETENCKYCDGDVCEECQDGYFLEDNSCQSECSKGYFANNTECVECWTEIEGCNDCYKNGDDITICSECEEGLNYDQSQNECTENCTLGFYPFEGTCQLCPSAHCLECDETGACILCDGESVLAIDSCELIEEGSQFSYAAQITTGTVAGLSFMVASSYGLKAAKVFFSNWAKVVPA
jgi:proprotein convertase subtilisin/kexin type 5